MADLNGAGAGAAAADDDDDDVVPIITVDDLPSLSHGEQYSQDDRYSRSSRFFVDENVDGEVVIPVNALPTLCESADVNSGCRSTSSTLSSDMDVSPSAVTIDNASLCVLEKEDDRNSLNEGIHRSQSFNMGGDAKVKRFPVRDIRRSSSASSADLMRLNRFSANLSQPSRGSGNWRKRLQNHQMSLEDDLSINGNDRSTLVSQPEPDVKKSSRLTFAEPYTEKAGPSSSQAGKFTFEDTVYGGYRDSLAKHAQDICRKNNLSKKQDSKKYDSDNDAAFDHSANKLIRGSTFNNRRGLYKHRHQPHHDLFESTRNIPMDHWWERLWMRLYKYQWNYMVFTILLGSCVALLNHTLSRAVAGLQWCLTELLDSVNSWGERYAIYVVFSVSFFVLAAVLTRTIQPMASGSGIPEMKTILSGVDLEGFLSFRVLVAKILGLIFVLTSGLSVGKEGPFVHTASIVATLMLRFPPFRALSDNASIRNQLLAAACAVGVSSTFGTPMGGVLFSIEVTAVYYMLTAYWKASVAAVSGAVVVFFFTLNRKQQSSILLTDFDHSNYEKIELLAFWILAVLCGLVGVLFVRFSSFIVNFRRRLSKSSVNILRIFFSNSYAFPICVSIATACSFFPFGNYMIAEKENVVHDLFISKNLANSSETNVVDWNNVNIYFSLSFITCMRFFFTAVSITLPVPVGMFFPVFSMGAAFGRLFGELLLLIFPDADIDPRGFSLVGAASMTAGATQTLSSAMILFELTGQINYLIPVLVSVVIATYISRLLGPSIYSSILRAKRLPFLPSVTETDVNKTAADIMDTDLHILTRNTTYATIARFLRDSRTDHDSYPIVDTKENMILLGAVPHESMELVVDQYCITKGVQVNNSESYDDDVVDDERLDTVEEILTSGIPEFKQTSTGSLANISQRWRQVQSKSCDNSTCDSDGETLENGRHNGTTRKQKKQLKRTLFELHRHLDQHRYQGIIHELSEEQVNQMNDTVELFRADNSLLIDASPFQVVSGTSFTEVHFLFNMLRFNHTFVTEFGQLVGVITKRKMIHQIVG